MNEAIFPRPPPDKTLEGMFFFHTDRDKQLQQIIDTMNQKEIQETRNISEQCPEAPRERAEQPFDLLPWKVQLYIKLGDSLRKCQDYGTSLRVHIISEFEKLGNQIHKDPELSKHLLNYNAVVNRQTEQ